MIQSEKRKVGVNMKRNINALYNHLKSIINEIENEKNVVDSVIVEDDEDSSDVIVGVPKNKTKLIDETFEDSNDDSVDDVEERNDEN